MLTASALTASAEATHRRLGGSRAVAARAARLSRRRAAGAGAQCHRGYDAGRCGARVRRGRIGLRCGVIGLGPPVRVAGGGAAGQGAARSCRLRRHWPSLDAVLIGGGPMPAGVAERASAAGISVVRTYGMSETAGGCVYDGVPLDGVLVRIDDGRVVLGGATLAKGYRNPAEPDPFAEPGWFRTDDIGAVDDSGVLRVLGRVDDAISTGGLTVLPQLVEAALATHPRWPTARCSAWPTNDWASEWSRLSSSPPGARHPRWPSCGPTSLQRCRRRPRRARCISSMSCLAAASARWTGASSQPDSPRDLHTISKLRSRWPDSIYVNRRDACSPKGLAMKNFLITSVTAAALGAAALGLAGTAAAFPNGGTAADIVDGLKAEGYNVQVNGLVQMPLKLCTATDVHPSTRRVGHAGGEAAHPGLRRCVVPLARLRPAAASGCGC